MHTTALTGEVKATKSHQKVVQETWVPPISTVPLQPIERNLLCDFELSRQSIRTWAIRNRGQKQANPDLGTDAFAMSRLIGTPLAVWLYHSCHTINHAAIETRIADTQKKRLLLF